MKKEEEKKKGGWIFKKEGLLLILLIEQKQHKSVVVFSKRERVKIKENGVAEKGGSVKKRKVELRFRLTFVMMKKKE